MPAKEKFVYSNSVPKKIDYKNKSMEAEEKYKIGFDDSNFKNEFKSRKTKNISELPRFLEEHRKVNNKE